jgi:hypothetical protein
MRAQGWTSPLMAFDSRKLLHYFRLLPNGRFLFGGRGGTDASDEGSKPTGPCSKARSMSFSRHGARWRSPITGGASSASL